MGLGFLDDFEKLYSKSKKVEKYPTVETGDYTVESIGKGKKTGFMKAFKTKGEAKLFARQELKKGRGVTIDKIDANSQRTIAQKNMMITGLGKGKYGKEFTKDYGKI